MISDLHSTDKLHFAFHVILSVFSIFSNSELDKNVEYVISFALKILLGFNHLLYVVEKSFLIFHVSGEV